MQITQLSAESLSALIHRREISCREVMEAYLNRIDALNPLINAIILRRDREIVLKEADSADAALKAGISYGWMHGFPQAIKDLSQVAGLKTTRGSLAYQDNVATIDDTHVARIRSAGAIIIGKTNTPEFGLGSHTYNTLHGRTRNPYNLDKSAGGSSGGAAAALAAHMLPVADGSDMMGSLRNPAGFCNIVGFRPSFGRVPSGPQISYNNMLSAYGPMGRNVNDTARLLAIQSGFSANDPNSLANEDLSLTDQYNANKTLVGFLGDMNGHLAMENGMMDILQSSLTVMTKMGCNVEAVDMHFDLENLWTGWINLRSWSVATANAALYENEEKRKLLKPEAIWEIERGLKMSGSTVANAINTRNQWLTYLLSLFERYHYLVLPTAQVFPFDVNINWPAKIAERDMDTYHRWMEVVIPTSMAGLPAISLPAGFSVDGLPAGVQIIGCPRGDRELMQFAKAFETARGPIDRPLDQRLSAL